MKVALFVGSHAGDTLAVRTGWWLTRLAQKGKYGIVTHCEAIHAEHSDGTVTIASASLRDGGVRPKRTALTPGNWIIADVPVWEVDRSIDWFAVHDGELYDWRGALATVLPGAGVWNRWFCNEAVGASLGLEAPEIFGPHQFAAMALTLGTDVTQEFFANQHTTLTN
jgi:hypothetical protein